MIKASTVKKLLDECVSEHLSPFLTPHGFNYLKSKQTFKRIKGPFHQLIQIQKSTSPLYYDEQKNELLLHFGIRSRIECPKLDKWLDQKLKGSSYFFHPLGFLEGRVMLDFDLLQKTGFYIPSASQKFKQLVTSSLIGPDNSKRMNLATIEKELPRIIEMLDAASSSLYLFEEGQNNVLLKYFRLLVFTNEIDKAKEAYLQLYQKRITALKVAFENQDLDLMRGLGSFKVLLNEINILLGLHLENPFSRTVTTLPAQEYHIRLASNLGYEEILRLDLRSFNMHAYTINDKGELLILLESQKLQKWSADGDLIKEWTIGYPEKLSNNVISGLRWLDKAQCFVCNNYIINSENRLIELKLDFDYNKFKQRLDPNLRSLTYDEVSQYFYLLYTPDYKQSYLWVYSTDGVLKERYHFKANIVKLNLSRKEVFAAKNKNAYALLNFKGHVLNNLSHTNGNSKIALSPDGNQVVLHFYTAKSQCYDLKKGTKKTLWAHPTYIKGYKEENYNDINHNFGMTRCWFSPDGKYLIGGAYHGKYVCWNMAKFDRRELIPTASAYELFNWFYTKMRDGEVQRIHFKPYVIDHGKEKSFINRGYDMRKCSFIDGGDYIITQHENSLLVWDSNFQNVGHVSNIGIVNFSVSQFCAVETDRILSLYRRQKA